MSLRVSPKRSLESSLGAPGRSAVAGGGILPDYVTGSGIVAAAQKEREWSEVAS
jgi:hypothetical protein